MGYLCAHHATVQTLNSLQSPLLAGIPFTHSTSRHAPRKRWRGCELYTLIVLRTGFPRVSVTTQPRNDGGISAWHPSSLQHD